MARRVSETPATQWLRRHGVAFHGAIGAQIVEGDPARHGMRRCRLHHRLAKPAAMDRRRPLRGQPAIRH